MRTLILFTALGALSISAFAQQPTDPRFAIKRDTAGPGTRIKEDRVVLKVPPDRDYGDLSSQQKAQVKSAYVDMPADDEPPYPIGGVKALFTAISDAQGVALVEGHFLLVANVDADGKVTDVNVYKSPSTEMAKVISSFLLIQKFKPAICGGKRCAMEYPINLQLVLD